MALKIIGAGMAGLLAANMLRHRDPVVIEAQPTLPNNHSALLRFRSSVVGDVLGISFKKVRMIKCPVPWKNPVADALAYSYKNTGSRRTDRSITDGMQVADRFIAPSDLIERMAERVTIELDTPFDFAAEREKVLSTIPMPTLAALLKYPRLGGHLRCEFSTGVNIKTKIKNCDAYVSLLIPHPDVLFSRISITGAELIIEIPRQITLPSKGEVDGLLDKAIKVATQFALAELGISSADIYDVEVFNQRYSKILPADEDERKNFIHWASSITGKAWQLGRFATWRPGLLLDDLVSDIRTIDRWMSSPVAGYEMDMLRGKA